MVRNLFVVNGAMVVIVTGYAHLQSMSIEFILPLLLAILLASIPVAVPATYTLAAALGSMELSKRGVFDHAPKRTTRYRVHDGVVQRQYRNPDQKRGRSESDLAGAGFH